MALIDAQRRAERDEFGELGSKQKLAHGNFSRRALAPAFPRRILCALMSSFRLFDLNPEQERAVRTTEGPLLILAWRRGSNLG